MQEEIADTLGKLIAWALFFVTLLVTPLWSLDPINPIKLASLSAFAFAVLAVLLVNFRKLNLDKYKIPTTLISGFILWQLAVLLVNGANKLQQLFGANGRNTGLIAYLAFSILFIAAIFSSSHVLLNRIFKASFAIGLLSLGYGAIQALGMDPFDWINPYSPVFGFLGNPNFQSSILGVLGSIVFAQLLSSKEKTHLKIAYISYLFLTLYVIKETASQQGFLVLVAGIAVVVGVFIYKRSKTLGIAYAGLSLMAFLVVVVGILNKGLLGSLLYKDSVTYRGDYWRAGWKMTLGHPLFGVGLDNYGDWYRRSRTLEATLRRGPDVTSNAAHNVYLDISSYGGFPLLVIYVAIMTLVAILAICVLRREKNFNPGFVGIFAGWVAFQAQSIISINQIGLAIWGWVLSGLIIGYEINTRDGQKVDKKPQVRKVRKPVQRSAGTTIAIFVGLIVGVLIGMPPYLASAKYKGALETSNSTIIQQAAYIWPLDPSRMFQVATTLDQNKLGSQGLKVAVDATVSFPDNYEVWATLYAMQSASEQQKTEALAQMKRLDPLNPNLK